MLSNLGSSVGAPRIRRVFVYSGRMSRPVAFLVITAASLAGTWRASVAEPAKALAPIPPQTLAIMAAQHTSAAAPLVIRTFKKEAELEIWKLDRTGRFVYIKTFPICRWSGQLGPKRYPGDRQTPEGIYAIGPKQMNPNSHYYLSFDTGFPNAYDKAHGASGSAVMVHGTCSSMGCFAMTDRQVAEIYAIAREALKGGQAAFQLQAYPFHMTARHMAVYRRDPNIDFWRQLKEGSDRFEATGELLNVGVANGRYTFAPSTDPRKEEVFKTFHTAELERIETLVRDGAPALATTYADGGQNAIFAALLRRGANLGTVSRPEALAYAGFDVTLVPGHRPPRERLVISVADWKPEPPTPPTVRVRVTDPPANLGPALSDRPLTDGIAQTREASALIAGAVAAPSPLLAPTATAASPTPDLRMKGL